MRSPIILFGLFLLTPLCFSSIAQQPSPASSKSAEQYPTLYASMGTPLYQSLKLFLPYSDLDGMKAVNKQFTNVMLPIYNQGMELSGKATLKNSERKSYLKALRSLQAERKRVMHHLTMLTMKAAEADDFDTFAHLVQLPLDELLPTLTTRLNAMEYYLSKRTSRIPAMDIIVAEEEKRSKRRLRTNTAERLEVYRPRTCRLINHTPTGNAVVQQNGTDEEPAEDSVLKSVGAMFKSMGIDFDPGLLEDYKSHELPTADDIK